MLLSGIFPPITTPYYPAGNVYFKKLEHNVERYSKTPVAGIVVLGSTGESVMLSDIERRDVLRTVAETAAPNKVLVGGTGMESADETLQLTEFAAKVGYDVALVRTPHFYRKQMLPANLLAFYRFVADRSPIPVLLYNVPPFTAYDLPAELVIELCGHPSIIGIKESGGDVEKVRRMVEGTRHVKRSATVTETFEAVTPRMLKAATEGSRELVSISMPADGGRASSPVATKASSAGVSTIGSMKTRQKEVGFQVLVGAAHTLAPSLEVGAAGAILGFAVPAPTACYEIYAAWKEGDLDLARLKQQKVTKASLRIVSDFGVPGIKYAMDLNGYYGGPARLPLMPLTADAKQEIEQLMGDIRN